MNLSIDTQLVSDSSILNKPVMQFHLLLSDEAFECWTNLTGSLNSWKMTKPIKHWMQEEFNAVQENHHILHCKQKQVISMQLYSFDVVFGKSFRYIFRMILSWKT